MRLYKRLSLITALFLTLLTQQAMASSCQSSQITLYNAYCTYQWTYYGTTGFEIGTVNRNYYGLSSPSLVPYSIYTTVFTRDGYRFVWANKLYCSISSYQVTVENCPPTANYSVSQVSNGAIGANRVTLRSTSTDPENNSLTYEWSTNNQVVGTGKNYSFYHFLPVSTTATYTLKVTDPGGLSSTITKTFTVQAYTGGGIGCNPHCP